MGTVNAAQLSVILNGDQTLLNRTLQQSQRSMASWARQMMGLRPAINVNTATADRSVAAFAARTKSALSGGFSVMGGALANFGGNLMTSALSKVTGGMSDLIQKGIAYNDTLELANISFRKFLGNQAAADQMIGDLKKFSKTTPFKFKGIVETSSVMAALGYEAKEIIPILTAVGDAVSAAGKGKEQLDSVIDALTKMRNSGKVEGEEMNRLMDNGIRGWKYLSDATGLSEEKIKKLAEQGQLNSREAVKIILAGMRKDSAGMMNEMSKTRVGLESNRDDALEEKAGQVVAGGHVEELKRGYQQQIDFIEGEGGALMVRASAEAGRLSGIAFNEAQLAAMKQFNIFAQDAKEGGYAAATGNAIINNTPQPVIDAANKVMGVMGTVEGAAQKILGWKIPGFKTGGTVSGPGTSTSDSIPANLSSGEYVINAAAAARVGYNFLDHINNGGKIFGFRRGGRVQDNPQANRARNEALLRDPRVRALLDAIAYGEADDYNEIVGGERFSDFSRHPNKYVRKFDSTAAGRYQFNRATWREIAPKTGVTDFSPHSQDLAAIQLMVQEGMIESLFKGNLPQAILRGNNRWASLEGAPYGQKTLPLNTTIAAYNRALQNGPVAGSSPSRPMYIAEAKSAPTAGPRFPSGYGTKEADDHYWNTRNYIDNVRAQDLMNAANRRKADALPNYARNPNRDPFTDNTPNSTKMDEAVQVILELEKLIRSLNEAEKTRKLTDAEQKDRKDARELVAFWRQVFPSTPASPELTTAAETFSTAGYELAEQTIPELDAAVVKLKTSADLIYKKFVKAEPTGATAPKPTDGSLTPEQIEANRRALIKPTGGEGVNWQDVMREESRNAIRQLLTGNFRGAAASFFQGIGNKMLDGLSEQLTGKWMDAIGNKLAGWVSNIMGKLLGGLFGGARAEGGSVQAGKMYRIRERGMDEYFVPNSDGNVYNQQQMNAMAGRGGRGAANGGTTVYNFNLPNSDREPLSRRSMRQAAREFRHQTEYATK